MKGLLTKDFALFLQRKRTFIFLAIWAVVMCFSADASFAVGWLTIISAFFAISSLSYDEYDNCYPFLMSLPVDAKTYALEKYVFGFICGFGALIFSGIISLTALAVKHTLTDPGSEILQLLIFVPVFMMLIDISLPLNMKLGSERGRIAILIIWGVIFAVIFTATRLFKVELQFDTSNISVPLLITAILAASVILTVISILISIKVMKEKEF